MSRAALHGKGPQRWPQKWVDRWLEEVAKAVGGGYCRLQMSLSLALAVRGTVAGRGQGALDGGRVPPPFQCIPGAGPVDCFVWGGVWKRGSHDQRHVFDSRETCPWQEKGEAKGAN